MLICSGDLVMLKKTYHGMHFFTGKCSLKFPRFLWSKDRAEGPLKHIEFYRLHPVVYVILILRPSTQQVMYEYPQ
jgi:hypothetical protein